MPADRGRLDALLRNDLDPASRYRAAVLLDYLDVQPGDRVLDCGCGLGWMLHVIGTLRPCRLFAIDADPARLARARANVGPRAVFARADATALPFPDAAFDKIVLAEVLEHLDDDRAALREAWRVLTPGGVVAITVPHRDYPFWWDPINRVRELAGARPITSGFFGGIWTDHKRLYTPGSLAAAVRDAGFIVEDPRRFTHYSLPFAHNLVYGLGKALVESGVAPSGDRFEYSAPRGAFTVPALAAALVGAVDRLNRYPAPEGQTTVGLSVKARKPAR